MSVQPAIHVPVPTPGWRGHLRRSGLVTRAHAAALRRSLACASPACRTFVAAPRSYCSPACAHRDAWRRPSAQPVVIAGS